MSSDDTPFIVRLYDMIHDGQYKEYIDWYYSPDDRKYHIYIKSEQDLLEKALVSIGVHSKSMYSFAIKLREYGFSVRHRKNKGLSLCSHSLFQKGKREDVLRIQRRSPKTGNLTPFILSLYDMIHDGQYKDCIDWFYSPEDRKYHIYIKSEQDLLEKALVSIGVHNSSISSFSSTLRKYGFSRRRLQKNGHILYSHSLFQKGNREDVLRIQRRPETSSKPTPFIVRLYDMIEDGQYKEYIDWYYSPDDRKYHICIKSERDLLEKALVSIGVHSKSMYSFAIKLREYGFSVRHRKNKGLSLCSHSLFQKGKREDVLRIQRRSPKTGNLTPFILSLYDMIHDGQYKDCIDWFYSPEDRKYHICIKSERDLLEKALVSIGVQTSDMNYFSSKLREYGFSRRRLQKNGHILYSHSLFQKGNREDVLRIQRIQRRSPKTSNPTPFMVRLYDMIEDGQYEDCIDWFYSPEDRKYHICIKSEQGLLEKALISIGVHNSSISSFSTSLAGFGFSRRRLQKKGHILYSHSLFQKGKREDVLRIQRRSPKSLAATETAAIDAASRTITPFLVELYDLIDGGQYKHCLDWHYEDQTYYICIKSGQEFLQKALVSIGVHSKSMYSFAIKLREYGFSVRHRKNNGLSLCSHSSFQKGKREDVWSILRRRRRQTNRTDQSDGANLLREAEESSSQASQSYSEDLDNYNVLHNNNNNNNNNKKAVPLEILFATPFGVACGNCDNATPLRHQQDCQKHSRRCWSKDDTRKPMKLFRIAEQKAISLRSANVAKYLLKGTSMITECSNCHRKWEKRNSALNHCYQSSSGCVKSCLKKVSCRKTTCGRWVPVANISEALKVASSSAPVANRSNDVNEAAFSYGWPMKDQDVFEDPLTSNDSTSDYLVESNACSTSDDDSLIYDDSSISESTSDASDSVSAETNEHVGVEMIADEDVDVEMIDPSWNQQDEFVETLSASTMGGIFDDAEDDPLPPELLQHTHAPSNHPPFRKRRVMMCDELLRIGMEMPRDIPLRNEPRPSKRHKSTPEALVSGKENNANGSKRKI